MIRSVYLDTDRQLRLDLTDEELAAAVRGGQGVLWVDLEEDGERQRRVLSQVFGFHQLAIDDCFNGRTDTPKVDDYDGYLFIIAQSVGFHSRSERLLLSEVDMFLGPNYVVTVRAQPVAAVTALLERARETPHICGRGADFLAHMVLDCLVDLILPAVEDMDEALDDLERRILEGVDKTQLPEILLLKRNTLRLRRSILPERDMVNRLSRGEFGDLIRREALMFYRDIYDHIVRVDETLEGLRDLADGALSSYLSAVNNRMNEVMKALSVVAVIFLPLTLMASIYGTNLDYSPFGLTLKGGFLAMLGAMVLVAGALVGYFRWRRWF